MSVNTYVFTAPMTFDRVLLVLSGQVDIIHIGRQGRVEWNGGVIQNRLSKVVSTATHRPYFWSKLSMRIGNSAMSAMARQHSCNKSKDPAPFYP